MLILALSFVGGHSKGKGAMIMPTLPYTQLPVAEQ